MKSLLNAICVTFAVVGLNPSLAAATVGTVLSNDLREPFSVLASASDSDVMYVSDGANHRIAQYNVASGALANLAGMAGVSGYAGGNGTQARFFQPQGMILARGGLIVADSANNLVRYVSLTGVVTNLAGTPTVGGLSDGPGVTARFRYPVGLAADTEGNIYVADSLNNAIRKIDLSNNVSTLAARTALQPDTVVIADLYQPGGLAWTAAGELWVANTRAHTIYRIDLAAHTAELMAGVPGLAGTTDSGNALNAQFNSPKGLYWSQSTSNLLVCDSVNHAIRRVAFDTGLATWSVTTYAGMPGSPGSADGRANTAQFNVPSGLSFDLLNRSYLVADRANNAIRRIQESQPLPPVTTPQIGVVTFKADADGVVRSVLAPVTNQVFYNDQIIAMTFEPDTQTYFTGGPTPDDLLDQIPVPGPTTSTISPYFHGLAWAYANGTSQDEVLADYSSAASAEKVPIQPDFTLKAVGAALGRQSSDIAKARFVFEVARPGIAGDNAADFTVQTTTDGAEIWYTVDGSEPTNEAPSIRLSTPHPQNFPPPVTNALIFKVRGFKVNYRPSVTASNVFFPTNYIPNRITFGFESGEASSQFQAAAGQQYFAPVTLGLLENQYAYSLQFSLQVSNLSGPAIFGTNLGFDSMLVKPVEGESGQYEPIPPMMSLGGLQVTTLTNVVTATEMAFLDTGLFYLETITNVQIYGPVGSITNYVTDNKIVSTTSLTPYTNTTVSSYTYSGLFDFGTTNMVFTNYTVPLLGVGWFERYGQLVLYDTKNQDLIQYSMPRNQVLDARSDRQVVLGAFSFRIPNDAAEGNIYRTTIDRPSGTSDGIYQPFDVTTWTKGSLTSGPVNSIKDIQVHSGSQSYLVGDAEPFRWLNAGDFGDTNLVNVDVMQVFQTAVYHLNAPPARSDLADAMDSSDGMTNGFLNSGPGYDYLMDSIHFGDGALNVDDIYVTFRRSLDPSLKWFVRYWTNGTLAYAEVPNVIPSSTTKSQIRTARKSVIPITSTPAVVFSAEDVVGTGSSILQVPIRAQISGDSPVVVLMLNLTVEPLDGSPALSVPLQFTPAGNLGTPAFTTSQGTNNYAAAWLNAAVPGITGTNLVGTLTITIPTAATSTAAYRVRFGHASASPNGLGLFRVQTQSGLITATDRSGSSWGDGISDAWRLKNFGTIGNVLSAATADADGDGVSNWAEFQAGTDPNSALSRLQLLSTTVRTDSTAGLRLRWPGALNHRYTLECSSRLSGASWLPVATNIVGAGAMCEFLDTNTIPNARFYRVRVQE